MGGGSLELVEIIDGEIGDGVTLPLGSLRLIDASEGDIARATALADEALGDLKLLKSMRAKSFYAVGGTWRNLGRLHMTHNAYPLNVLSQYEIATEPAKSISNLVAGLGADALQGMAVIPTAGLKRCHLVPWC